ncbi:hypothetical protein D9M72_477960 [compost metagenome]
MAGRLALFVLAKQPYPALQLTELLWPLCDRFGKRLSSHTLLDDRRTDRGGGGICIDVNPSRERSHRLHFAIEVGLGSFARYVVDRAGVRSERWDKRLDRLAPIGLSF